MKDLPRLVVSGLVNIETTLRIESFPIPYFPVSYAFNGVFSSVSGVGANVAKALHRLGAAVDFCCLLGKDSFGELALSDLREEGLKPAHALRKLRETPQSVILYDQDGRRQIHVDLKDIQEQAYPKADFEALARKADLAVLCNINYNRPLLETALSLKLPIATDVHVLRDPDDTYNADFMDAADILFLSNEGLWSSPEDAARQLMSRYRPSVIVIGLGFEGALFLEKGGEPQRLPARLTRPIVNTIGAGDALFSAFIFFYLRTGNAEDSLKRAILFASWKIGEKGAACGFLTETELLALESPK